MPENIPQACQGYEITIEAAVRLRKGAETITVVGMGPDAGAWGAKQVVEGVFNLWPFVRWDCGAEEALHA